MTANFMCTHTLITHTHTHTHTHTYPSGFAVMTRMLMSVGAGRVAMALEGG